MIASNERHRKLLLLQGIDLENGARTGAAPPLPPPSDMRQLHSNPIAVSGRGHTRKQINSFDAVIHMQESPPHKRFLVGCSSPFTRLAEYLTALHAW